MGIVWNWKARRGEMTSEQTEDAQSGEWIIVEVESRTKPTIKEVIRTPDSVTIIVTNPHPASP